jgi:hypothetical protein
MSINPKELQKFYDLWAPMLAAIPTVINAVEHSDELTKHVAILEAQRDKALSDSQGHIASAQAQVAELKDQLKQLAAQRKVAQTAINEAKASAELASADAERILAERLAANQVKIAESEQAVSATKEALRIQLSENDKAFLVQKAEQEALLAVITTKRDAAEKALEKLLAKFAA